MQRSECWRAEREGLNSVSEAGKSCVVLKDRTVDCPCEYKGLQRMIESFGGWKQGIFAFAEAVRVQIPPPEPTFCS
jgi:hypothetical protein